MTRPNEAVSANKRASVAYAPVAVAGRWKFCRIEGETATPLRDCAACDGHGAPGDAIAHYILGLPEPSAGEAGREVQG